MRSPMKSPLDDHPATATLKDESGRLAFRVMPRALTPQRAQLSDQASRIFGFGLLAASLVTIPDWQQPELPVMTAAFIGAWLGGAVLRWGMRAVFHTTTPIELGLECISVCRHGRWERFDRHQEHCFALLPHDQGEQERRRNEFNTRDAAARGEVVQMPVYFGDSFHVVLIYAGHRVDLMSIYGRQRAAAVVARLQYCDRVLEQEAKRAGAGDNPHASDDWYQSPGGL